MQNRTNAQTDRPVLQLRNLNKTFGQTPAVCDLNENFRKGEYVCILGPSGCGKSTLLRLVAGFEQPTSGDLFLNGAPLNNIPPERRDVNMVFQNYALFPHMTVHENVAFGLRMKKQPREEIPERVQNTLNLVNLGQHGERYPHQLSGGQQQRVALARAIINRPSILLLDEPLGALDKNLRLVVQDELLRIQRDLGITFIHVTHDQGEALRMADRVAIMRDGRFVQVGAPQAVYHRPRNGFVADFLGSSNLLEAGISGPNTIVFDGGVRLQVAEDLPPGRDDRRITVLVRPEKIELHPNRPARDIPNLFTGEVLWAHPMGADLECRIQAGNIRLRAHTLCRGEQGQVQTGDTLYCSIAPEDLVVLPPEDTP